MAFIYNHTKYVDKADICDLVSPIWMKLVAYWLGAGDLTLLFYVKHTKNLIQYTGIIAKTIWQI